MVNSHFTKQLHTKSDTTLATHTHSSLLHKTLATHTPSITQYPSNTHTHHYTIHEQHTLNTSAQLHTSLNGLLMVLTVYTLFLCTELKHTVSAIIMVEKKTHRQNHKKYAGQHQQTFSLT